MGKLARKSSAGGKKTWSSSCQTPKLIYGKIKSHMKLSIRSSHVHRSTQRLIPTYDRMEL